MNKLCKCGRKTVGYLVWHVWSHAGQARKHSTGKCMRCIDKEAFALMSRGVNFISSIAIEA